MLLSCHCRGELDFIQQQSEKFGYDSEAEIGPIPTISRGIQALPSKSSRDTGNEDEMLRLHFFDPLIPCADGSPSGIFVEKNPKVPYSQNHVLVFIGGAACADPQDCEKAYLMEPFKFSTNYYPSTLEGDTVLSRDPNINPMMHNYTKWLVPYCSQDFFLGDVSKGKVGNFTHAGSLIFDTALKYWQDQVHPKTSPPLNSTESKAIAVLDNVVVVGLSAGSIGVMNKVDTIRSIVNSEDEKIQTRNLKIILDSPSVMSDQAYVGKNLKTAMVHYTNLIENPLCHPLHPFTRNFERMSSLPCCLSTHCMLRYDERLSSFYDITWKTEMNASNGSNANTIEELLILDSAYDPFALMASSDVSSDPDDQTDLISDLFRQVEIGGQRKTRGLETAAFAKSQATEKMLQNVTREEFYDQPRVKWIFSSCYQHVYLVPASAILEFNCLYGNYEEEQYDYICRDDGHAFVLNDGNYFFRVWRTIDTWDKADFRDESMHEIINNFVRGNFSDQLPSPVVLEGDTTLLTYDAPDVIDFRLQPCVGPNCREHTAPASAMPSCQALIETENYFVPALTGFEIFWSVALLLFLVVTPVLRIPWNKSSQSKFKETIERRSLEVQPSKRLEFFGSNAEVQEKLQNSISIRKVSLRHTLSTLEESDSSVTVGGISAVTSDGKNVVTNANISFKYGTLSALCGKSGSGKSTLLKALSLLHTPGMEVTIENGSLDLERIQKAFLRQHDDSESFGKLVPEEYLHYTAQILGCDKEKTIDVLLFAKQLFARGKQKKLDFSTQPENYFDPFISTKIENLSGGQRRFLSIAVTLLSGPKLLLLDEPLSGLDSASCMFVLEGLQTAAQHSGCAVFMTVHQPSEKVLEHFDKVFLMDRGRLIFQESVTFEAVRRIHTDLENHMVADKSLKEIQSTQSTQSIIGPNNITSQIGTSTSVGNDQEKGGDNIGRIESKIMMFSKTAKQLVPLARRLQPQFGWEPISGCALVLVFCTVAILLRFESFYPQKVVAMCLALVSIPSLMFPHKVVEHALMWKGHKQELDDREITPLAFQISTALYTFPVPIFSLLVGHILVYLILVVPFESFMYQYLISSIHLLCSLQVGRVLMVWFRGEFSKGIRFYVLILVYALLFSGVGVSTNKPPEGIRWLYWFSINFWGVSGSVLRQFDSDVYSNTEFCTDLVACLSTDGNTIVRGLGFAPMSNTIRALIVLSLVLGFFSLLELAILHYQFTKKSTSKS